MNSLIIKVQLNIERLDDKLNDPFKDAIETSKSTGCVIEFEYGFDTFRVYSDGSMKHLGGININEEFVNYDYELKTP